jgi:hypothetical protein
MQIHTSWRRVPRIGVLCDPNVQGGILLWIARTVYNRIDREPVGVVARRLHDKIVETTRP